MTNNDCQHSNTYDIRVWVAIGVFYETRTICGDCGLILETKEVWVDD